MRNKEGDLCEYRFSEAEKTLESARLNMAYDFLKAANNRAYYAVFYAMKAVLALDGVDFKRHKAVLACFNRSYIAAAMFPRELGKRISKLKMIREASDYDDFYLCTPAETKEQIETADWALGLIREYLKVRRPDKII